MFYPLDAAACRRAANQLLDSAGPAVTRKSAELGAGPGIGAIVPHAGWICSGAVAAESIHSLARRRAEVDVVVVFGAIHTPIPIDRGVLDSHVRWAVPGGESSVTTPLRDQLSANVRSSSRMTASISANMRWRWNCP